MHAHDRHLARARSKAHTQDTRKDEARAFTRASRRAGKVSPREIEDEAAGDDDVVAAHLVTCAVCGAEVNGWRTPQGSLLPTGHPNPDFVRSADGTYTCPGAWEAAGLTDEEAADAEFARWEEKREVARVIG